MEITITNSIHEIHLTVCQELSHTGVGVWGLGFGVLGLGAGFLVFWFGDVVGGLYSKPNVMSK